MPWESRGHLVILAEAVTVKRQARGAPTVITMTTRPQSRPSARLFREFRVSGWSAPRTRSRSASSGPPT